MTLDDFHNEVLSNLNGLVANPWGNIGRLIGFCETSEDYYWIVREIRECKVVERYYSCVGSLEYFKNLVSEEEYIELDVEYEKIIPKTIDMILEDKTDVILTRNKVI